MDDLILSKLADSEWLLKFLKGNFAGMLSSSYLSEAEGLIGILKDEPLRKRLSLTVDEIFLSEYSFAPSNGIVGDATLLLNLLHIIEIFPANEKTSTIVIRQLFEMTKNHQFQGWPDDHDDALRFILMALASRISKVKSHSLKLKEVVLSFGKITNHDYLGLIFCVISRLDIRYAINILPGLLTTLKSAGCKHRSFLLDFPGRVGEDEVRWLIIISLLKSKNLTNDIELLRSAVECWKMPAHIISLFK